jgi:hypothetical protein
VVDHIVAKSDGVPLYVVELTKAILGSGVLKARGDTYVLTGALAQLHIPETLQDSLMARLDRAPRLREVAQLGSVLGREFAYDMISALAGIEEDLLHQVRRWALVSTDSPTEGAVSSKPVSEPQIPCYAGKIQGISFDPGLGGASTAAKRGVKSVSYKPIPYASEQGFFAA